MDQRSSTTQPALYRQPRRGLSLWLLLCLFFVAGGFLFLAQPAYAVAPPPYLGQWGGQGSGNGQFRYVGKVAVDSAGNVYVADYANSRVQKFSSTGTFLAKWGAYGTGNGQFQNPYGIALDSQGNIYVTDITNHNIQKFTSNGAFLARWGGYGTGNGQFNMPHAIAVDRNGDLYVADKDNHRIQKFNSNGVFLAKWGSYGSGNGQFHKPTDLAFDSAGNLYVTEDRNHRVQKFDSSGAFLATWGSYGTGNGQFNHAYGIAIDKNNNIYIDDAGNNRIQLFTSTGSYLTQWGSYGSGNGQFQFPSGLALNRSNTLIYVTDNDNHRVQIFGTRPTLLVQSSGVSLVDNDKINVPVVFTSNGASIASVGFGLDYQESCLSFDATDSDNNGVPDTITGLPAAFAPSISHQPSKSSGELEIALYDDLSPISTLSDGTLFTVQFMVKAACLPAAGAPTNVTINFASTPAVSFGDPTGQDVTGSATGATIPLQVASATAPTALTLDNSSVAENSASGASVGLFSTVDPDVGDSFTYSLVSGAGDTDNAAFTITSNTLKTAAVFDYESKSSYTIRVRTTDSSGAFFEQSFTISVTNLYEAPTSVVVGSDGPYSDGNPATLDLNENAPADAIVATFVPAPPNSGSTYTYVLVAGVGDNSLFTLTNGTLTANISFDYENKNSYTVVVRVTDQEGNSVDQTLTLTINNQVNETVLAVDDLIDPRVTVFLGGVTRAINVLANDIANGGTLAVASVTQPATGRGSVINNSTNISYTAPQTNGDVTFTYQASDGVTTSNSATVRASYVANHARGDCNGNGAIAAADFIGVVLEIFDANNGQYQGNPAWWLSYTGDYAGSPLGCDANNSGNGIDNTRNSVTAADIICTVLLFFGHECGSGVQAAGAAATAHLAVADGQTSAGATTTLTVTLATGGNAIAAATFALKLDPTALHFDATDANEDGVPDAITLHTPAGMSQSASWNPAAQRLEVALFGMSLPLPTLSDGTLATVTIAVAADPGVNTTPLPLDLVSFSDPDGNDLPFTEQDGTLTIDTSHVQRTLFLPLIVR